MNVSLFHAVLNKSGELILLCILPDKYLLNFMVHLNNIHPSTEEEPFLSCVRCELNAVAPHSLTF